MPRYVVRPRAAKPLYVETPLWDDAEPHRHMVDVDGPKEVDTGLVTASGEAIYRIAPPIGFGRMEEW